MYMLGAAAMGIFGFVYFGLLDTGKPRVDVHSYRALAGPARHDVRPAGCAYRRIVHGRLRYSGSSWATSSLQIIAGGPAPIIATWLFATYKTGFAIAIFMAACAVVSLVAASFMPDYTGKDISAEYDA